MTHDNDGIPLCGGCMAELQSEQAHCELDKPIPYTLPVSEGVDEPKETNHL